MLLLPFFSKAQITINGYVTDSSSGEKLSAFAKQDSAFI
ncbi:MAG: hypothetical protein RL065_1734, partial [Bacteroidota bacterium]